MDRHFKGPFGWRFGWDGLLGLVPVVGDLVTNSISVYVILRAARLGCPPSVILRMGLNLLVENLVDIIPFFGNLFDFFWKANSKNMALMERYFEEPHAVRRNSVFVLIFAVGLMLALVAGSIVLSVLAIRWLLTALGDGRLDSMSERFFSGAPWENKVAYCRAIRYGPFISVSGTTAVGDDGDVMGVNDGYVQAKRCLEIIERSLQGLGAGLKNVTRTRMFVTDISLWEDFARAHSEAFKDFPPATSMLEVKGLIHPWLLIEIEADAYTG